ncbi:MAG: YfhO family protein [Chloroflexi bacterium]|nr:YfhO family protein [Chloroflexota bacterium]
MPSIESRLQAALLRIARHPATPLLVLVALPFLFFWRLVAPNPLDRMQLPDGDLTLQYYPLRVFAARELAAGRLPLWNPAMYAGQPGLADSQMATLYPPNLLTVAALALIGKPFTFGVLELQVVLHYALAAVGMFLFARRVTHSPLAAWIAALAFTFGGYLISYPAQQASILAGDVWLPFVLWALHGAATATSTPRARWLAPRQAAWLALAGTLMATSILAGHPQTYIYVFYTSAAYWLYASRSAGGMRLPAQFAGLLLFGLFGIGLSAVQLLPTLEFTRYSTRAQLGYDFTSGGFALHELITLIAPGYFGGSPLYVGLLPLLLAGFALFAAPHRSLFWLALAAVALFLSFGNSTFVYSLFYLLAPGFALVRDQERAAFLWSLALAMLAALGAARLTQSGENPAIAARAVPATMRGTLAALGLLIAGAYVGALFSEGAQVNLFPGYLRQFVPAFFYAAGAWALWHLHATGRLRAAVAATGLAALVALNLFTVNGAYNFQKPTPSNYFPDTPLTRALQAELAGNPRARVASEGLLPGAHNAGAHYGFAEINGNDPLRLATTEQFDRDVNELRRFQLLGVRYVVTKREIAHGAFGLIAQDGDTRLYGYSGGLPRAWIAHTAVVVAPGRESEALNSDAVLDAAPAGVVVLSEPPPFPLSVPASGASTVEDLTTAPGRVLLNAGAAANGILVFSEINYPGWQATIDGAPAQLMRADGILIGAPLPAGRHHVELTFSPDSVKIGALVTLLTGAGALAAAVWGLRRARP